MYKTDKIAQRIVGVWRVAQEGFASRLHQWVNPLGTKQKKGCLLLVCFLIGGYSLSLIVKGFLPGKRTALSIQRISVPAARDVIDKKRIILSPQDDHRLQKVHAYLDSLKDRDPKTYDSLLQVRPHLLDSLRWLDSIYQQQKRRK